MWWVAYGLVSVLFWGGWGFMGKVALRHGNWIQISLYYGVAIVLVFGSLLLATSRGRSSVWEWNGIRPGVLTGLLGTAGLITFYLALERGKASMVVPLIGVYPIITAALSVGFLGERLTVVQATGIALAAVAVVLISLGR